MNTLGVILARAGSIGLPGKHLLPLLGRPVIDYTFAHVRGCERLMRVVVSSDCPQVLAMGRSAGFDVIERPADLAGPEASVQAVMLHALKSIESTSEFRADALAVIYGNVPVRPADVTDRALALLESSGCDSVRSFCPVGKWHPMWMSKLEGDRAVPLHANSIHRRQDLTPLYLHDGAALVVSRASMLRGLERPEDPHAFFGVDRRGIAVEPGQTIEIDHRRDLYWAEALLRERAA